MTLSPTAQNANSRNRLSTAALALRIVGSAVFAIAMTPHNVAIAGPSDKGALTGGVQRQSMVVMIDHLQRVSFDEAVQTVLVGNPAIADVTMISSYEAVVTAKTVGSTNLFFLDPEGHALGDYEVVVREGEERRVVLRRGPSSTELFQCAPRCERTLSQIDTTENYVKLNDVVKNENQLVNGATAAGAEGGPQH